MGRDSPHHVLWTTFFMVTTSCRSLTAHDSERKRFSQHELRDAEGSRGPRWEKGKGVLAALQSSKARLSPLCVRPGLVPGVAEEVSFLYCSNFLTWGSRVTDVSRPMTEVVVTSSPQPAVPLNGLGPCPFQKHFWQSVSGFPFQQSHFWEFA